MRAGVSSRDITPPIGAGLAGHTRHSTGIHDPLFARVLVLDDHSDAVAIIGLDMLNGDFAFCDAIRTEIRQRTGITHTLINFSQTHSSPDTVYTPGPETAPLEAAWIDDLKTWIPEVAEAAYANRMPVSLHASQAPVQIGFNRRAADDDGVMRMRVNEAGAVVPWVNVLEARKLDGQPLAVLFEHAAHPVIVHAASSLTGTDFTGFAVNHIQTALGADVTAIFAQGCCANINGFPWRGGWDEAHVAGVKLGDAALEAMQQGVEIQADKLTIRSDSVMLPCALPSMEQLEATCTQLKIHDYEYHADKLEKLDTLRGMIARNAPPELRFDISVIGLGTEWGLVAMSHEPFCEYELWASANSPFDQTMVLGDTNAMISYVATDQDLVLGDKGGYEAGGFPCFWSHTVRVLHAGLAVGIEGMIKDSMSSLWEG